MMTGTAIPDLRACTTRGIVDGLQRNKHRIFLVRHGIDVADIVHMKQ